MKTNLGRCFRTTQLLGVFRVLPLLSLLLFGISSNGLCANELTMATIQAAWRSRELKLNSIPFRLEWAQKQMRKDVPKDMGPDKTESKMVMIAKGKKLRLESSETGGPKPMTRTIVWQGNGAKVLEDFGGTARNNGSILDTDKRLVD